MYHYTECGLRNVWLENGYIQKQTSYGLVTSVIDVKGLHLAIALEIINNSPRLTGAQVRFLRKEMDLSQDRMAEILGVSDSSIRAWENHRTRIPKPADRLLRSLYEMSVNKSSEVCKMLENLAHLDRKIYEQKSSFSHRDSKWTHSAPQPMIA